MKTRKKTIRKFFMLLTTLIILIGLTSYRAKAQSMGISSSAITPDASSILEMRTTTKGMLIPRMTTTERNAISAPATGLMIYNTTTSNFNFYNGSSWIAIFSGSSGVTSVSGTTNRISIGGTSADPIVDISSGYVGQSSLTTLGTIGTGTWNGSTIGIAYGGTGQTTQQAAINALTGTQTSGTYLRSNGTNASLSAIQVADVPALNQNTTGSAATLTTSRNIYGNAFNGSADVTGIISSTYGGTGNGFTKFSGPATSEKIFTLPNASATILTDNAAVTVAQGGTGVTTLASNGVLYGNGTGAIQALPVNSSGTVQYLSQVSSGTPTWVTPTNGTVTSVSGTTNRITVATGTTTPVIDISSSYVGQSSITTLGTIGTGTWNGTLIGTTYGGTGTSTALTQGSIVFAGASGIYSQNNSKFFWDNTNFRLGLGTAAPNTAIQVGSLANGGTDNILLGGAASPGYMLNTLGTDFGTFYSTAANTVGIGFTPTTTVPSLAVFKVNKTGAATFGTSVSTDDNILIQPYIGGSNSFAGRITTVDLTAGRTYTLPDASGNLALTSDITQAAVGLGNVDNTSDANKPVSTATQAALNLKANIASPAFTGTVTIPSPFTLGATSVTTTGTELNYVAGVTSSIQTQLNNKQSSGNYITDPGANGIVARTSLNTTINRTITGTTNRITLTNGDGVSGNPTIDVGSNIVDETVANTYTAGAKQTFVNSATTAGLNLTPGADPSAPASGDFWNSTTTANSLKYRDAASATRTLVDLSLSQTLTNKTLSGSTNVLGGVTMTLGSDATGDLYYRNSSGILTRLPAGSNGDRFTVVGGLPSFKTPTSAQSTPADPATTTSTTGVMMGLAGSITPGYSGKILIIISGDIDNSTSANGAQVQIRYGTGTAPANGAALTGTTAGSLVKFFESTNTQRNGIHCNAIVSGLTVSTAYWIDLSLAVTTAGTARIRDISISVIEI
jgi:hypothetical protein